MLHLGGLMPVADSSSAGYELASPDLFPTLTSGQVDGHAVKLLDAIVMGLWPTCDADWRIIWLHRNPREQAPRPRGHRRGRQAMTAVAVCGFVEEQNKEPLANMTAEQGQAQLRVDQHPQPQLDRPDDDRLAHP